MTGRRGKDEPTLSPYQRDLVDRLQQVLDRLDRSRVTDDSGLKILKSGKGWAVQLTVEAQQQQVPGLYLSATPDQCILGFADSEVLECHGEPGGDEQLVGKVVEMCVRYLSGTTVVEHYARRGWLLRVEYFYGIDSEAVPGSKIGTSTSPLSWICKVKTTATRSFRFLREEGAAQQGVGGDEGR